MEKNVLLGRVVWYTRAKVLIRKYHQMFGSRWLRMYLPLSVCASVCLPMYVSIYGSVRVSWNVIIFQSLSAPEQNKHWRPNATVYTQHHQCVDGWSVECSEEGWMLCQFPFDSPSFLVLRFLCRFNLACTLARRFVLILFWFLAIGVLSGSNRKPWKRQTTHVAKLRELDRVSSSKGIYIEMKRDHEEE